MSRAAGLQRWLEPGAGRGPENGRRGASKAPHCTQGSAPVLQSHLARAQGLQTAAPPKPTTAVVTRRLTDGYVNLLRPKGIDAEDSVQGGEAEAGVLAARPLTETVTRWGDPTPHLEAGHHLGPVIQMGGRPAYIGGHDVHDKQGPQAPPGGVRTAGGPHRMRRPEAPEILRHRGGLSSGARGRAVKQKAA